MSRMRSFTFPKINASKQHEDTTATATADNMGSPYQISPSHSRESSAASTTSSPITPTFSARGHNRWPSSSSSLVTSPDSPAATPTSKSPLGDLVEDPSERDDPFDDLRSTDEPLCICDTPWCEHRQESVSRQLIPLPTPEWSPGDDYFSDGQLPGHTAKRRRSGEYSTDSFSSRLSRRFPSIRKRLSGHRSAFSVSSTKLRSAPSSRSSSLRLPTTRSVTAPATPDIRNTMIQTLPPPAVRDEPRSVSPPRSRAVSSATTPRPIEIDLPAEQEESTHEFASTPLLPPMLADYFNDSSDAVQSPLQSPTIAGPSAAASLFSTPVGTPVIPGFPTPPLSAKASMASLRNARSGPPLHASTEIPPLTIAEEVESADPWATKLGHANFEIEPVPYLPAVCDAQTCKQLTEDWECARKQYMQLAGRVRSDYGPTSQTFKLTEQKWAEIDATWRANHEMANAEAQATGDSPTFQPLAETMPIAKLPSLNDPQQPGKYPTVEEKDIVGPMVTYAKIQHDQLPARKTSTILKLFTDPGSLLGRRSNFSVRR
ncbi:hypothetical protein CLAFUW4_13678 [Fulvia fulva]|uniref:Only prolin and serin are matching in the corresponding protein n=1 Tax=Passalora fulva TaxID=5499 RepID=A0A9Q8PKD3_PASFU|nr:uncharacterized protein CLAFUR5_13527 [Fulvia fulva]KAK4610040.1 hypothetical protein CLAFUR4_13681 [Fulvia fulva]KAK4611217.1 hypothetical protein CLAFUR0_13685 [Fulvia fulva]UJO24254.1 hypothetical protein CLAFUR5_13527 [Fulvia fulva]WPV21982.1 hypothetical protein CLAFUW4_13678 [Fulvia fulva]WPV37169.1 hypothetical protein CLAFUW7_13686 [Fulvia fulva]